MVIDWIPLVVSFLYVTTTDSYSLGVCGTCRHRAVILAAGKRDNSEQQQQGYKFGDISRSIWKSVNSADKETQDSKKGYRFGDVSRYLDRQAKKRVNQITGKGDDDPDNYVFGDLTRWVDSEVKSHVNTFTNQTDYRVGDITKEIIRRVQKGEYNPGDVWLTFRVLVSAGISITPIANALPVTILLNLIKFGLAEEISGKAMEAASKSLEDRITAAVTGDANYKISDMAAREIEKKLMLFLGKDSYSEYEFGDITRALTSSTNQKVSKKKSQEFLTFTDSVEKDLADWDERLLQDSGKDSPRKVRETG